MGVHWQAIAFCIQWGRPVVTIAAGAIAGREIYFLISRRSRASDAALGPAAKQDRVKSVAGINSGSGRVGWCVAFRLRD